MHRNRSIRLVDEIGGTLRIVAHGDNRWTLHQRNHGPAHDNNHNPAWLRIENDGRPVAAHIEVRWASPWYMACRRGGYQLTGRTWRLLRGEITPTATRYEVTLPPGRSHFGVVPWYSNEDADRFFDRARRLEGCSVRSIGRTGEGREIRCLTVERGRAGGKRRDVVVLAREHATETSGSFAVEGTARFILGRRAPREWLRGYRFHFLPVVNPDGVASGIKLTRMGDIRQYDMVQGGMLSDDPTMKALREELIGMKPHLLIMHHAYIAAPAWLGVFSHEFGIRILDRIMAGRERIGPGWHFRIMGWERRGTLRHALHCMGSNIVLTELPWTGRLPAEIGRQGVDVLKASMETCAALP